MKYYISVHFQARILNGYIVLILMLTQNIFVTVNNNNYRKLSICRFANRHNSFPQVYFWLWKNVNKNTLKMFHWQTQESSLTILLVSPFV